MSWHHPLLSFSRPREQLAETCTRHSLSWEIKNNDSHLLSTISLLNSTLITKRRQELAMGFWCRVVLFFLEKSWPLYFWECWMLNLLVFFFYMEKFYRILLLRSMTGHAKSVTAGRYRSHPIGLSLLTEHWSTRQHESQTTLYKSLRPWFYCTDVTRCAVGSGTIRERCRRLFQTLVMLHEHRYKDTF